MDWHDEAAKGLPTPRDDEPTTLRQDILDELSDHLGCALSRELTKNISADEAIRNVRRRFGDPRAIARRLWFDAMRNQMMSQRLTLAMMVILACTSALATAFAWVAVRDGREANAAILEKMAAMANARSEQSPETAKLAESNAKTLATLSELASKMKPAESTESLMFRPVKFHLVRGKKGGPPAANIRGQLIGPTNSPFPHLNKESDANGDLDFGLVPYGQYTLTLTAEGSESYSQSVVVRPRASISEEIVCPPQRLRPVDVRFAIDWPASLGPADKFWVVCNVEQTGREFDGYLWSTGGNNSVLTLTAKGEILFAKGRVSEFENSGMRTNRPPSIARSRVFPGRRTTDPFPNAAEFVSDHLVDWTEQRYAITDVAIVYAWGGGNPPGKNDDMTWTKHGVPLLGWCSLWGDSKHPFYDEQQDPRSQFWGTRRRPGDRANSPRLNRPANPASGGEAHVFQPAFGQKNVESIALPEPLVKQGVEFIAAAKKYNIESVDAALKSSDIDPMTAMRAEERGQGFLEEVGIIYAIDNHTLDKVRVEAARPLSLNGGIVIQSVRSGFPADRAKLRTNDILVGLDRWRVDSLKDIGWIKSQQSPQSTTLKFIVIRGEDVVSGQFDFQKPPPPAPSK